ncbi:hypothetical protein ABZ411_13595, partial [Streptomyces albidoflavus]
LVVEDDAQLARALRINLEVRSYEVAAARDGDRLLLDLRTVPEADDGALLDAVRAVARPAPPART